MENANLLSQSEEARIMSSQQRDKEDSHANCGAASRRQASNCHKMQNHKRRRQTNSFRANLIIWPLILYSLSQAAYNLLQFDKTIESICAPTTTTTEEENSSFSICNLIKASTRSPASRLIRGESSNQICSFSSASAAASSQQFTLSPQALLCNNDDSRQRQLRHSLSGSGSNFILFAEALHQQQPELQQPASSRGIIILNSTNFNNELIQFKHQFPHIKVIEYYVSYCKFCMKFKQTFLQLARDVYEWRNILRPSAIDLSVSSNSPIAQSWSIDVVPTIRIHPPPLNSLAEKLNQKFIEANRTFTSVNELQRYMHHVYSNNSLYLKSLPEITKYIDKPRLLKMDLLNYIKAYIDNLEENAELPATWPNLRPVKEGTLIDLLRNHPRQELFLIIEGPSVAATLADQSNLGLQIMMELSSSGPYKAVRYVKASENRKLIKDVIIQHKKGINGQASMSSSTNSDNIGTTTVDEQLELLNNLLSEDPSDYQKILLVHIDDSHSPINRSSTSSQTINSLHNSFPFMNIINLQSIDQSLLDHHNALSASASQRGGYSMGARARRSLFSVAGSAILDKMANDRKVELLSLYIKQTYTESNEDRRFLRALNSFDETESLQVQTAPDELQKLKNGAGQMKSSSSNEPDGNSQADSTAIINQPSDLVTMTTSKIYNLFGSEQQRAQESPSAASHLSKQSASNFNYPLDYGDKLKAIRYMLFNEIPRSNSFSPAQGVANNLTDQVEKVNTLVNLITVIKFYFPLPDSASIQFIDGVQSYLVKQQLRLQQAISNKIVAPATSPSFDVRLFKQELKRLENEDRRLPEIKEWKHCTNYPCALWRLFHTLAAFEYKKLNQIRQQTPVWQSTGAGQNGGSPIDSNNSSQPTVEAVTMRAELVSSKPAESGSNNEKLLPFERLSVSLPSTTTSLSLTIAPTTGSNSDHSGQSHSSSINQKPLTEADLPQPVILVMRDYITTFFSCDECRKKFKLETQDLSNLDKIRHQEPAEYSIMKLWEIHNSINKRLSVDPESNPKDRPKIWFPSYQQCMACYEKPPTFIRDLTATRSTTETASVAGAEATDPSIFHESILWNRAQVLNYLVCEYTKQPMDYYTNIFGYQVSYGLSYIIIFGLCCLVLLIFLRTCLGYYIERQRRHKATLLNGNGVHYSLELQ